MASIDSGSESAFINGLNDGNFNDVFCDNLEVSQNAIIDGSLTVGGAQIYSGTATFANAVQFNGPVYGLTGGVGVIYDPVTRTISSPGADYWSLTGSDLVNKAGTIVNITREGGTSKLVLNYGATGATRVGIFYNDNNSVSADYPLITTGTTPDELLFGTPNNQAFGGYISMKPRQLLSTTADRNYVILQKPDGSSQTIESSIDIGGSLNINSLDYKTYFSATGYTGLSYNGAGEYSLDLSGIQQSKWDLSGTTIYPKTATQLLIGSTGPADTFTGIHIKSDTTPSLLVESLTGSFQPSVRFKNQASLFGSISQDSSQDRIDVNLNSLSNVASFLPGKVGVNTITPSSQLEVKNEAGASSTVVTSYNDNSGGYAGSFLKNDLGNSLVMFGNGSTRSADGGPNAATIRNDTGEKIRLQNNYEFSYGPNEVILGDPQAPPLLQGSSLNDQFSFQATVYQSPYIYTAGWYLSTASSFAKNLDGTNSSFSFPSSGSIRKAFIIQYTSAGIVNNIWSLPANVRSEVKNLYVGANKIYIMGTYSSTASATVNNITGTASAFTLPLTNVLSNYYAGYILAFDSTSGLLNRYCTINGGSNNANENYFSSVVEDSSGNVFACGTVRNELVATINNMINSPTGQTLAATLTQSGFVIRWDFNANYTGHWAWNIASFACYVNDITIVPGGNTIYLAASIFTLGSPITIPNWNGGGSSAFQVLGSSSYSNAIWSSCLIRFTNITAASPTVSGRESFGNNSNVGYSPVPVSSCSYCSNGIVYWACPFTNVGQLAFFSNLGNSSYDVVSSPPQSSQNTGIIIFAITHNSGGITAFPAQIWSYSSGYSGVDFIYRIREGTFSQVYLSGGIYSDNSPVFRGFNECQTRVQFPFNSTPGVFYYYAFCLKLGGTTPLGMSLIPYSQNQSFCADICFPSSTRGLAVYTIAAHSSQFIRNFDQYNSPYSLPVTTNFNLGVLVDYTFSKTVSTYFASKGVGLGRQNSGVAELEVEKGIYTPSYVQCSEVRVNDFNLPFKFTDSIGREIGSICRAWVCIDGTRTFQPIIKASMNVRYLEKPSNGRYRIYFSNAAPHDRYATFVSSCGYLSNNFSIMPFISTSASVVGAPTFKTYTAIEVAIVQTGGTGYDVAEFNVACFW